VSTWPRTQTELVAAQEALGRASPEPWTPPSGTIVFGGSFVCFRPSPGRGRAGDAGWAGAVATRAHRPVELRVVAGKAGAPYRPGLLALREGALLEAALRALQTDVDVVLVNGTGRDHPRRAGFAVHIGAVLGFPTAGVTHRPLFAQGAWPADERGATAPLELDGEVVGYWLRTRVGRRPLAVHAGWRVDAETAAGIVRQSVRKVRTPEPLRIARRIARVARAANSTPPAWRPQHLQHDI
jgi:deoxyribonuclease V